MDNLQQLFWVNGRVRWNGTDTATIRAVWVHMEPKRAGDTVVSHEAVTWALFERQDGVLVTRRLDGMRRLPNDS